MEIRYATIDDEGQCNRFYNRNYGRSRSRQQWLWEFVEPNSSPPLPYVIALEDGKIVGTQGYIPIRLIDEKGSFSSAKSEETLIETTMRGRGVLDKMYEKIFDLARANGCASIWGFTPADRAFRKLGFAIPGATKQLLLVLAPRLFADSWRAAGRGNSHMHAIGLRAAGIALSLWRTMTALLPSPSLKPNERVEILCHPDHFDEAYVGRFIANWGGTTILRDQAYMRWRLFENPYKQPKVVGYFAGDLLVGHAVYQTDADGSGYLVDLLAAHPSGRACDERIARRLLDEAITGLKAENASSIRAWTITEHPFDKLIRRIALRRGFLILKRGSAVVFHTGFRSALRETSHDDFANWYVTRLFTEGAAG